VKGFMMYSSAPASKAGCHVIHLGLGGDHDDSQPGEAGILAQLLQQLETIHLRHVQSTQQQLDCVLLPRNLQGLDSVGGLATSYPSSISILRIIVEFLESSTINTLLIIVTFAGEGCTAAGRFPGAPSNPSSTQKLNFDTDACRRAAISLSSREAGPRIVGAMRCVPCAVATPADFLAISFTPWALHPLRRSRWL